MAQQQQQPQASQPRFQWEPAKPPALTLAELSNKQYQSNTMPNLQQSFSYNNNQTAPMGYSSQQQAPMNSMNPSLQTNNVFGIPQQGQPLSQQQNQLQNQNQQNQQFGYPQQQQQTGNGYNNPNQGYF